jgi:hypothetical protein
MAIPQITVAALALTAPPTRRMVLARASLASARVQLFLVTSDQEHAVIDAAAGVFVGEGFLE